MIIDGKAIAEEVLLALEKERAAFGPLRLGIVTNEGDAATDSFVRIKSRIAERLNIELVRFAPAYITDALKCDGVIVQLPMPGSDALLDLLPPDKDVDALGLAPAVRAPVAEAVAEVLSRSVVDPLGKVAIVVGAGRLVGLPVAALLKDAGAEVSVITQTHGSLDSLKNADIVVLGAGEPGLVQPRMLKPGVVLIDAGTSEQGGKLSGDADPACAQAASVFTPVPGGIGPIAVAMIFKNLLTLVKSASAKAAAR